MIHTHLKPLTLAVVLCTLGSPSLATPAFAANLNEEVTVTPAKTISPKEEETLSAAGVKVLRHIAQARADISNKEIDGAKTELGQTRKLLDIIQAAMPTTEVKDRIWIAKKHLEYQDSQEVLPDLLPIYTSLDELTEIMPVDVAKQHLDKAKEHLKSGDKAKAKESLEATAAALQYTEMDLPLSATRQLVARAESDLNQEKADSADKALKAAEDSVVYLSMDIEQPLFTAKALLWQTVLDLDAGDKDLAKSDLQGAIGYLEAAGQSGDQASRDASGQILAQARQLQKDLEGGSDISEHVRHLWERTHALADRSMEYISAGWDRYRAESPLKSELIEAKLHLSNARIDLFTGHEAASAGEELSTAMGYLDQAVEKAKQGAADDGYQKRVTDIRSSVQALGKDPASAGESRYVELQQELGSLIRLL
ncbi:MAG: YfdX family protein [Thiogranum sp.]